ncbi:Hypothetical predicted protein [Podarcis lilfordi]|uniref:Uncharacterized protein n=1 Tax=Podarcis lilfordi TaxID=74358 RepID=A0AA35JLR6_9SAUR|nr:Hypothetical predicted protein [Podarcis lilfordi]
METAGGLALVQLISPSASWRTPPLLPWIKRSGLDSRERGFEKQQQQQPWKITEKTAMLILRKQVNSERLKARHKEQLKGVRESLHRSFRSVVWLQRC